MSVFGFLQHIAQGDSKPGGGVFGFLNQSAQSIVNPISKAANEAIALPDIITGNQQGASNILSQGGGLGHQGGVLGGAELNKGAVFLGPNAKQNITKTVGTGLNIGSTVVAPGAGNLAETLGGRIARGALFGAGIGTIGNAGAQIANTGTINPKELALGAVAGGVLGGGAPIAGQFVKDFRTGNEVGAVGKNVGQTDIPLASGGALRINNDVLQNLVKSNDTATITRTLANDGLDRNIASQVAPAIATTKDPNVIANLLDRATAPKVLSPAPTVGNEVTPPAPLAQPAQQLVQKTAQESTSPAAQQVVDELQNAQKLRNTQETAYSAARSQNIGQAQAAAENLTGTEAYKAKLAALQGPLAEKPNYTGLSDRLSPDQQENLYSQLHSEVEANPQASPYTKLNTQTALRKVIFGEGLPTNSDIKLLQNQFGDNFANTVKEDVAAHNERIGALQQAGQILGVPRAIMASADFSASLRQGLAISTRHPIIAAKAFANQFKYAFNEGDYQDLLNQIENHPNFPLAQQAKLAIQSASGKGVSDREEQFASSLAERIPGLGKVIHGSNRAYTGFLDSTRFNVFSDLVDKAKSAGIDFSTPEGDKILKQLGEVVNTSSGRGSLGALEKHAGALSTALFAPRLIASRLQMLYPRYYIKLDPIARKEALTTLMSLAGVTSGILGLAKAAGASVNADPTNADFGKIKIGDTRFDILGGYQQYIRLGAQLAEGKITSSTTGSEVRLGDGFGKPTRLDIVNNFLQGKENPVLSFATTLLKGKDVSGNNIFTPKGISGQILQRFVPLITQDFADLLTHPNSAGPASIIPGILGVGEQTYGVQDLPLSSTQQGYIKELQQTGADKTTVAKTKSFFQTLKSVSGKQQNTSDAIDKALAKGDMTQAQQLADTYNQGVISGLKPWVKDNSQYLNQDLVKQVQSSLINLDDSSIQSRLKGIVNNPTKYGLPVTIGGSQ